MQKQKRCQLISIKEKKTNKAIVDDMVGTGDAGTDYGDNKTSSKQKGHFSNDKATLTYSTVTDGELKEYSEDYDKPVVQKQQGVDWRIVKKSDTPGSNLYLAGAEFQLLQDGNVKYTGTSVEDDLSTTELDEKGFIQWEDALGNPVEEKDIPAGEYVLKETKAPDGYSVSDVTWEVTIKHMETPEICPLNSDGSKGDRLTGNLSGSTYVFVITNEALYALPSAGGPGIYWYTLSGTLLMAGAALIVYRQKRKREVLLRK